MSQLFSHTFLSKQSLCVHPALHPGVRRPTEHAVVCLKLVCKDNVDKDEKETIVLYVKGREGVKEITFSFCFIRRIII